MSKRSHNRSKAVLALLLAAIALLPLAGCQNSAVGEKSEKVSEGENSSASESASDTETTDYQSMTFLERIRNANAAISDDLPEEKYDGRTFIVYGKEFANESDGDAVNDSQYSQMLTISERFDLNIETCGRAKEDWNDEIRYMSTLFNAGEASSMDLYVSWNTATAEMLGSGYFYDMTLLSNIDTSKPWYFEDEMMSYGYKGHYWLATGFMDPGSVFGWTNCILFNKDMVADYGLDNFYDVVRDGNWTIDYFNKVISDFYSDVNGDGVKNEGDIYGAVVPMGIASVSMMPSVGMPQMYLEDGEPKYSVYEKSAEAEVIWNKLRSIFIGPSTAYTDWTQTEDQSFNSGNSLFKISTIGSLAGMRELELSFGTLPIFKADEYQEDYYSCYLPNPFAIPYFAADPELSAVVMTAMAAEGYKQVLPNVYETAIKMKYTVDEESGEMIDLMMQNVRADTMFVYGDSRYIYNLMFYCMDSTAEFTSYWAKQQSSLKNTAEKQVKSLEKLINQ